MVQGNRSAHFKIARPLLTPEHGIPRGVTATVRSMKDSMAGHLNMGGLPVPESLLELEWTQE
jgi:hypothetical protein